MDTVNLVGWLSAYCVCRIVVRTSKLTMKTVYEYTARLWTQYVSHEHPGE